MAGMDPGDLTLGFDARRRVKIQVTIFGNSLFNSDLKCGLLPCFVACFVS